MSSPYSVPMSEWFKTPIRRTINPKTGLIEGDDGKLFPNNPGYRGMPTLLTNASPLVVPAGVLICSSYDGRNEYGQYRPEIALAGGLDNGQLVLRETPATAMEFLNQLVAEASEGQFQIVLLDGFRSGIRQAAGFTRLLREQMKLKGLQDTDIHSRLAEFLEAADTADGTFSWVNLQTGDDLERVISLVKGDRAIMQQIGDIAAQKVQEHFDPALIEEEIVHYLTVSANSGIGHGTGLPLNFENNAHAGGGACDVFVVRSKGLSPLNIVPFDYAGPEAGMDFMEQPGAFDAYKAAAATNEQLSKHLKALGCDTVDAFQQSDWSRIQSAIRILYHASMGIGCTYYSSTHGGENWHLEPGNRVFDPATGNVVAFEKLTVGLHPDSGNPGHALQKLGPGNAAVWGGHTAHQLAKKLGLQM